MMSHHPSCFERSKSKVHFTPSLRFSSKRLPGVQCRVQSHHIRPAIIGQFLSTVSWRSGGLMSICAESGEQPCASEIPPHHQVHLNASQSLVPCSESSSTQTSQYHRVVPFHRALEDWGQNLSAEDDFALLQLYSISRVIF